MNLKNKGISGNKLELICELSDISINKNSVFGDTSALNPGGVRIGTSALTTRGLNKDHFIQVGNFIDECTILAQDIQKKSGSKLVDFKTLNNTCEFKERLQSIKSRVNSFAEQFKFYIE